ncbi:MAG: hypothetical protein H0U16_12055 [Actinobacteria bacterium]|nr:hypothetical protein [Actinomycetota bacterium]
MRSVRTERPWELVHERAARAWIGGSLIAAVVVIVAVRRPPLPHDA